MTLSDNLLYILLGRTASLFYYQFFHKQGHIIWVSLSVSLTRDDSGKPLHFIAQIVDITEKKNIENTLEQSEERYRTLFHSIDEGFCIIEILFDEQGKPIDLLFL